MIISVDEKLCSGVSHCAAEGVCIEVCALGVVSVVEDKPVIGDGCVGCGLCVMNCPREAILLL